MMENKQISIHCQTLPGMQLIKESLDCKNEKNTKNETNLETISPFTIIDLYQPCYITTRYPAPKPTVRHIENRPFTPKEKFWLSSRHPFSGVNSLLVSGRVYSLELHPLSQDAIVTTRIFLKHLLVSNPNKPSFAIIITHPSCRRMAFHSYRHHVPAHAVRHRVNATLATLPEAECQEKKCPATKKLVKICGTPN